MSKSTQFPGQPILGQLLSLIPKSMVASISQELGSDRYYKKFKTYDHIVSMLFGVFSQCSSLRELTTGMMANGQRLAHLGLKHSPRRSTLADANAKRDASVFEMLFQKLHRLYFNSLSPDSLKNKETFERLFIVDSTTITLFTNVMRGVGLWNSDGRRKGGAKAHVLIKAKDDTPSIIRITESIASDRTFIKNLSLPKGSIIIPPENRTVC